MKKIILLLSLIPSYYYSQVKTDLEVFGNSRGSVFEVTNTNIKQYPGIDGIPYLDENFHPITIEGYNKNLPFDKELKGNAEIVTQDLRLIERFFYQIRKLLGYQV